MKMWITDGTSSCKHYIYVIIFNYMFNFVPIFTYRTIEGLICSFDNWIITHTYDTILMYDMPITNTIRFRFISVTENIQVVNHGYISENRYGDIFILFQVKSSQRIYWYKQIHVLPKL